MSKDFQLMIDEKIEKIAARIKEVYHPERNEAIRLIKTTKLYKALTEFQDVMKGKFRSRI